MPLVSPDQFSRIARAAREAWGLEIPDRKRVLVEARITSLIRQRPNITVDDVIDGAFGHRDPALHRALFDALATNVTGFNREFESFGWLAEHRWRRLAVAPPAGRRRLRIWCAACSTGPEVYSLAIQLRSTFDATWDIRILASDLSTRALRIAKVGTYTSADLEPLGPSTRDRWFRTTSPDAFTVQPSLRRMVTFRRINLVDDWPLNGPFDLIMCRNVMIYFARELREHLVRRAEELLTPDGVFVVGSSESLTGIRCGLTSVFPAIYVRGGTS